MWHRACRYRNTPSYIVWLDGETGTERQHGPYGACRSRVCCCCGAARPTRLRRGRKVVSVVPPAPAPAIAATAAAPSPAPSATSAQAVDALADDSTPGMEPWPWLERCPELNV